jgi:hypothetical protein
MASYSNSSYTNDFFNLNGIYFNSSTGITTGLAPIESNSSLYLLKSGGTISSNLLINGSLDVKSTFTLENIGNVATAINEKQDLITDESLTISKTLNLQNSLDDLQDNINLKQNIINDGDLTISKILNLTTILAGKQDVTTNNTSSEGPALEPSSTTFNEIISSSIINNNKNIEDRDHFHYASSYGTISKNVNQAINFNLTKRGPALVSQESFIPKYTGLYSISCSIFLGTGSTGALRLGVNINGTNYNLNGADTYIVCATTNENADGNMLNGNIIVDATAGQTIRLNVRVGTIKYLSKYSYFHGYYIGAS